MPRGKILRLTLSAEATVVWSDDYWKNARKLETVSVVALGLWFADFPTKTMPDGSVIEFTLFWKEAQRWEGRNYSVKVSSAR